MFYGVFLYLLEYFLCNLKLEVTLVDRLNYKV